jgi:CubicO group peptidase (beta-lactamase class C family)
MRIQYQFGVCGLVTTMILAAFDFALQDGLQQVNYEPLIDEYRRLIPEVMQRENIPGVSVAIVDKNGIIWTEGFGFTDEQRTRPVTDGTIFSVQSISKTFTATAVLHAVQEGVLDLDVPIRTYLPNFNVNSRFEDDPLRAITLRHLLSHRAGFTHEAPVGNNFDATSDSFEHHALSIADTWLKFPVGETYSYSNLGVDLAGYILQVVSGIPFHEYVQEKIFDPLEMINSSFDMNSIRTHDNRAVGHSDLIPKLPLEVPMIPSGGLYSSAADMARYVQFHLNRGEVGNKELIRNELLEVMYKVPFSSGGQEYEYALGIDRWEVHETLLLNHGGGGFGFLAFMGWYPDFEIGIVTLTNSAAHPVQVSLPFQIIDKIVEDRKKLFGTDGRRPVNSDSEVDSRQSDAAAGGAKLASGPNKEEWRPYVGTYRIRVFGQPARVAKIRILDGHLDLDGQRLEEYESGLFFTADGEALDMRNEPPTFRNIRLEKLEMSTWEILLLGGVWLLFASFILGKPTSFVFKLIRRRKSNPETGRQIPLIGRLLAALASLVGILYSVVLLAVIPFALYYSFPWHTRYPAYVKGILITPLVYVVIAATLLIFTIPVLTRGLGTTTARVHFLLVALSSVGFVVLLIHWKQLAWYF